MPLSYQLSDVDRTGYAFLTGSTDENINMFEILATNGDAFSGTSNMLFMDIFSGAKVNTTDARWLPVDGAIADATYSFNSTFDTASQTSQILFGITDMMLQANTAYALSVYSASGSSFQVRSTIASPRPGYTSDTGATMPEFDGARSNFLTTDGGATWEQQTSERIFAVGYAVPEPSTISMMALMMLIGGVARCKARRA